MHWVGHDHIYIHTVYDRIFGDFPAKNTVYAPYIHGSGQPYSCSFWHSQLRCHVYSEPFELRAAMLIVLRVTYRS